MKPIVVRDTLLLVQIIAACCVSTYIQEKQVLSELHSKQDDGCGGGDSDGKEAHGGELITKQAYQVHRKQDDVDVSGRG